MASAESGRYNNTVAFDYDAAGRLTSESLTVTFGQTTTYTVQSQYDAANRRTGITYPDGSAVARQYTARHQLAQIDYNSAMVATFAYDNGSRRTSRTLGDTPGTQTTWVYGRQDNLPTAINSAIPGASFSYTYDANKNKLTEGISTPMANFGFNSTAYDPADRLTAWNRTDGNLDQAWGLSLVGNWASFTENQVQQTRTHTSVHEIAAIDSTSVLHDATGNLTRNASDTLDRYTWDFDNRLATADVDQDGTAECGYQYDARGRRVSKMIPDGEGSVTTVFVYLGNQVVSEYTADTLPTSPDRKFVYATYIDEPVVMIDRTAMGAVAAGTDELLFYHCNSLYSVAAITDASGNVVERCAYSAYGKPLIFDASMQLIAQSAIGNPYLFTGRRLDPESGLYYYRARMYDTELGRFVSRDPIGYEAGANLYEYVGGVPLSFADPFGLTKCVADIGGFTQDTSSPVTAWGDPEVIPPDPPEPGKSVASWGDHVVLDGSYHARVSSDGSTATIEAWGSSVYEHWYNEKNWVHKYRGEIINEYWVTSRSKIYARAYVKKSGTATCSWDEDDQTCKLSSSSEGDGTDANWSGLIGFRHYYAAYAGVRGVQDGDSVTFTVAWGAGYEESFEVKGGGGPKSSNWSANVNTTTYQRGSKRDTGNGTEITVTCKCVEE